MRPVHSGGCSQGRGSLTLLKRWPLEAWQSHVFATRAIFPILHGLVAGEVLPIKRFPHLGWPEENSREVFCWAGLSSSGLEPAAGTCVGKGILFWSFPEQFSPLAPDPDSLGLVSLAHTCNTFIFSVWILSMCPKPKICLRLMPKEVAIDLSASQIVPKGSKQKTS